jgi:hypothetical protein
MSKSRENRASSAKAAAPATLGPSKAGGDLQQRVRELEVAAAADARNLNNIIEIQKVRCSSVVIYHFPAFHLILMCFSSWPTRAVRSRSGSQPCTPSGEPFPYLRFYYII